MLQRFLAPFFYKTVLCAKRTKKIYKVCAKGEHLKAVKALKKVGFCVRMK